jgi:RNA polymerase sigma-70 factor, ECF subfamily
MFIMFVSMMPGPQKVTFADYAYADLPILLRVAQRMTRNPVVAEDLVGQTILTACKNWDQFDGRYPRSWVIQLMRNEWMNMNRKAYVRKETTYEEVEEPSDKGFWEAVETSIEAEQILNALDELPEDYRLAITLCDVEEMIYEQAAESLNVPLGTIRSRLFRGRKLLRSRIVNLPSLA